MDAATEEEVLPELGNLMFGHGGWIGNYPVSRESYSDAFHELLEAAGLNGYGVRAADWSPFENNVWRTRAYWWGDEDAPEATLANFEYAPTFFKLWWYKYPLRDSYSNQLLTEAEWSDMLSHCMASLGEPDATPV